jgi:hypothetical protein
MNIKGVSKMRKTLIFMITIMVASLGLFQNAFAATKTRSAISPYVQSDNNSTYTFVGITHPSLNTAGTQIGLSVTTVGMDGTNPSTSFTIDAGQTYRIFIVSTNHSTINSVSVTGDRVIFLSTTTGSTAFGSLLVTSNTVDPTVRDIQAPHTAIAKLNGLNQLSMWGAIVIPSTSTGFAMEFIGDAHDSVAINESGGMQAALGTQHEQLHRGRGIK